MYGRLSVHSSSSTTSEYTGRCRFCWFKIVTGGTGAPYPAFSPVTSPAALTPVDTPVAPSSVLCISRLGPSYATRHQPGFDTERGTDTYAVSFVTSLQRLPSLYRWTTQRLPAHGLRNNRKATPGIWLQEVGDDGRVYSKLCPHSGFLSDKFQSMILDIGFSL